MSLTADPEQRQHPRSSDGASLADQPLPEGTVLRDYELREVAGSSAWSIVYVAWDRALRRRVAVQEYRPLALGVRRVDGGWLEPRPDDVERYALGLKAFLAEARLLARFDHPALVRIYRFWEEHGTAYRALSLCEGPTLEQVLAQGPQDEAAVRGWLRPVLDAVSLLHAGEAWHHHIVPASIVLSAAGPVLMDMGAARRVVEALRQGPAAAADPGYSALELHSDAATRAPGPWTDLYAIGAMVYRALCGVAPPPATDRARDDRMAPLVALARGRCSARFAAAIEAALVVQPERRTQNDADFRALAGGLDRALPSLPPEARDLMGVPFVADATREVTVPIPTQPAPLGDGSRPRDASSVVAVPARDSRFRHAPAPMPFERRQPPIPRAVWWTLAAGTAILGIVAIFVVRGYAQQGEGPLQVANGASGNPSSPRATPVSTKLAMPAGGEEARPLAQGVRTPAPPEPARAIDVVTPPRDERDREERCADLLQEATLRRLAAVESAFFKAECR